MIKLKNSSQSKIPEYLFLFYFYGATYITIEVFFRGYSHWTMFLLGAFCGIMIGLINNVLPWKTPLILQAVLGGVIVTLNEFIFGYILNIKLGLGIWDYSNMWGDVLGQICPLFSVCWCVLSLVAIVLDDYIKYWFFDEKEPKYKWL